MAKNVCCGWGVIDLLQNYQTFPISPGFYVSVDLSPSHFALSDEDWEKIETCWEFEKERTPLLFNGKLLTLIDFDETHLLGKYVDYKLFVAKTRLPELKNKLPITPISLSGFTTVGDDLVLAKRSPNINQYPEFYELAPSGGFDLSTLKEERVDIKAQFYQELEEELGVESSDVNQICPWKVVINKQKSQCEICIDCTLKEGPLLMHSKEYSHIQLLPFSEVPHFVAKNHAHFLPFSLYFLQMKGLVTV